MFFIVSSAAGFPDLAARLEDVQYELVNRLIRFLYDQLTNVLPHSQPHLSSNNAVSTVTPAGGDTTPSSSARTSTDTVTAGGNETGSSNVNNFNIADSIEAVLRPATQPGYLPPYLISCHQHATEHARQARSKLIKMPSVLLEELSADLYDEVGSLHFSVSPKILGFLKMKLSALFGFHFSQVLCNCFTRRWIAGSLSGCVAMALVWSWKGARFLSSQ